MANTKPEPTNEAIRTIEYDGYKLTVDTDLIDDVDAFEIIDRIENKQQTAALVELFKYFVGEDEYQKMKAHFVKKYGRLRMSKLAELYKLIIESIDPKE